MSRPPILLVDLSNNNPEPNFAAVKRAGVAGVWLKVSEGTGFVDHTYASRARAARAAGLRVGGYHFARPNPGSAIPEADQFADHLGPIARTDLRPVLDLEVDTGAVAAADCVRAFNGHVRQRTGTGPVLYSYRWYLERLRLATPLGYGLWLADYGDDDGADHGARPPRPWKTLQAHQFTSRGRIDGIPGRVDLSHAPKIRPLLAHPLLGVIA